MLHTNRFGKFARSLALVASVAAAFATVGSTAQGQPISSNADNQFEYNAYINSYMAWVSINGVPNAVRADIDNAATHAEMSDFELERNLAMAARSQTRAAFYHAYLALRDDDNSQWEPCTEKLVGSIEAFETLLDYQELIGADSRRMNSVRSGLTYLQRAADASFMADFLATGFQIVRPIGRP